MRGAIRDRQVSLGMAGRYADQHTRGGMGTGSAILICGQRHAPDLRRVLAKLCQMAGTIT